MSAAVVLINPKNPHNAGGAIRAAHIFGATEAAWTGPRVSRALMGWTKKKKQRLPREERMREYQEVMQGHDDGAVERLIEQGYTPVAVEFLEAAENLIEFVHPEKAVYVFGPEDGNVPKRVLAQCHRFVRIPGRTCLNVAAAVNVVLYDRLAKNGGES